MRAPGGCVLHDQCLVLAEAVRVSEQRPADPAWLRGGWHGGPGCGGAGPGGCGWFRAAGRASGSGVRSGHRLMCDGGPRAKPVSATYRGGQRTPVPQCSQPQALSGVLRTLVRRPLGGHAVGVSPSARRRRSGPVLPSMEAPPPSPGASQRCRDNTPGGLRPLSRATSGTSKRREAVPRQAANAQYRIQGMGTNSPHRLPDARRRGQVVADHSRL